jgi:hypothetical protein
MKKVFVIIMCAFAVTVYAQKYKAGMFVGPNLSFLTVNSDYSFFLSDQYQPGFGFEVGAMGSLKLQEKFSFDHTITFQYLTHRDTKEINFTNEYGTSIFKSNQHIVNNRYITLSPQISYYFIESMFIGTGVNVNLLIYSYTNFKDIENIHRLINTYYKPVNIGIPVLIGYSYDSFFLRFRFDIGISNLLKDSNSFFREKENTLSLNIGYFFFNE